MEPKEGGILLLTGNRTEIRGLGKEVCSGSLSERLGLVDEVYLSRKAVSAVNRNGIQEAGEANLG
jgi:hypothetical protein